MRSAVYEGVVTHRRYAAADTGNVAHDFSQSVSLALVYLDELDAFFAQHPLWSTRHPFPVQLRRSDYVGNPDRSLEESTRDLVEDHLGRRPAGPVALLGHLRTWGWLFNPLTLYYCYDVDGETLDAVVLEVTNTPWHERHVYVLDAHDEHHRFHKEMHVSPFLRSNHDYVMHWNTPGELISVHVGNRQGDERLFDASMVLRRRGSSRRDLASMVWRRPLQTYGISANIYRQALRLWRKGAPFVPRTTDVKTLSEATTQETSRD